MQGLIEDFSQHLRKAVEIGSTTSFTTNNKEFNKVLVCGLGGSGIGGTNVQKLLESTLKIPLLTNKGYHLPAFVDPSTLVICCSYSGNTEETLAMYEQAAEKGAEIAVVCSGGKFEEIAGEAGLNHIIIPGGLPPRAAFGLAFPQLFFVLNKYALIDDLFLKQFEAAIKLIDEKEEAIRKEAKELSDFLFRKRPVLYAEDRWEGVLVRFRQQMNENSKMLSWHQVVPEMNHNEIVGWREESPNLAVVLVRDDEDYYRNQKRFDYVKKVISEYSPNLKEVHAKGASFLEKAIYLIHLCDWASFYLAESKGIDSVEVDVISGLKDMLAGLE